MQILMIKEIEGPNIYSYNPVLRVKLDIGQYDNIPSSNLPSFCDKLLALLPGLKRHCCSRGYEGGFVERLREGTYLAHIFEHVLIELQNMAGYKVGFGKTRYSGISSVYDVVAGYREAQAAKEAAYQTEYLLKALLENKEYDIQEGINKIKLSVENTKLGPSTEAIYRAALKRNIPVMRFGDENLLILGYGSKQQRVWATITGRTKVIASDLAGDKNLTKQLLHENGIPVPYGMVAGSFEEAVRAWKYIGKEVAVKPLNGNQGRGVTLNVSSEAELERAFNIAQKYDPKVIVEECIPGRQYRLCIVDGKMIAAAERIPAHVIGDGIHTIKELVEIANGHPERGEGHGKALTKIKIDEIALCVLAKQKLCGNDIVKKGTCVYLRESANLSTGGIAIDVTNQVNSDLKAVAERAAKLIDLDVAGVDIVAKDITKPLSPNNGAIIEINAAPGIRMHHYPIRGKSHDVGKAIVDYLFKEGNNGRIPIIAVTGTNGKTTVTRMIAHIWASAGYVVGMTTTDGIYINSQCILAGDTTGPQSARIVLNDPTVEVAVLETARGGILRGGLAFDKCDVGIITNITEDHLGQDGIEDLEDLAYIKALVVEVADKNGYAILNADDSHTVKLSSRVNAEIIYFSAQADNNVIKRHLGVGGTAFFVKDKIIYAARGKIAQPIIKVADIPVTLGGLALHNIQNAVIAAAACYCKNIPIAKIREGLSSFENNPGRLNIIEMGNFKVCIDYGHNPAGYEALINTVSKLGAKRLVGVIAAPGDRRDDGIINLGCIAGRGFDKIYIKEDADLRGRQQGEVASLLLQGVKCSQKNTRPKIILDEKQAVMQALKEARKGDLIVIFYEKYKEVIAAVDEYKNKNYEKILKKVSPMDGQIVYKNIPG